MTSDDVTDGCAAVGHVLARIIHEGFCCNRGDDSQNPVRYSFFAPRSCNGRSTLQTRWRCTWTRPVRRPDRQTRRNVSGRRCEWLSPTLPERSNSETILCGLSVFRFFSRPSSFPPPSRKLPLLTCLRARCPCPIFPTCSRPAYWQSGSHSRRLSH